MAHIQGCFLLDAQASALNNAGTGIFGERDQNTIAVKYIYSQDGGYYPYISGQAFRYWLRTTLQNEPTIDWIYAPVWGDEKGAFTDANPILYWDDDLFGYMRAAGVDQEEKVIKQAVERGLPVTRMHRAKKGKDKETISSVTRLSPFRVSTLVSIGAVNLTRDWGVMARQDSYPVLHEHQFYDTTFHALFSCNLREVGKFYYQSRSGFQNLDEVRIREAREHDLTQSESERVYRFDPQVRVQRVRSLLMGLGRVTGGAKLATHYTDVSPTIAIAAVLHSGNHPFNYLFKLVDGKLEFLPEIFVDTVDEIHYYNDLLSPIYIGWKSGFLPEQREKLVIVSEELRRKGVKVYVDDQERKWTPRIALDTLAQFIGENPAVMDA